MAWSTKRRTGYCRSNKYPHRTWRSHAVAYAQMDVVVQAAATPGTGGAWLKLMREGGVDLWTAIVTECKTVRCLSEAQLCLSLSLARSAVGIYTVLRSMAFILPCLSGNCTTDITACVAVLTW